MAEDFMFVFIVQERCNQHQQADRYEDDRFGDRIEMRHVEKDYFQQCKKEQADADNAQVPFFLPDPQDDHGERIKAPDDAQPEPEIGFGMYHLGPVQEFVAQDPDESEMVEQFKNYFQVLFYGLAAGIFKTEK
jgi:hypothetical protein